MKIKFKPQEKRTITFENLNNDGQDVVHTIDTSFVSRRDFLTFVEKEKDNKNAMELIEKVIRLEFSEQIATTLLNKCSIDDLSNIFVEIMSAKMNQSREEFLNPKK